MAELLLEILSEEIPSRMQLNAREQLKKVFTEGLTKNNLSATKIQSFVSTRRLVLFAEKIEVSSNANLEVKGPKTDALVQAVEGFARKYNKEISDLEKRQTEKGEFYFLVNKISSQQILEVLTNLINDILLNFTWPKSMRWSNNSKSWVRPIRNILCLYDGKILPVNFENIKANRQSIGHRFLSDGWFEVRYFVDYSENLKKRFVILDFEEKLKYIESEILKIAEENNLVCKSDNKLLEEVAGLVEWPSVLLGKFKSEFLNVPEPILTITMKTHQRYFPLYKKNGDLSNYFIAVANSDQKASKTIIQGNEKVLAARLSDAQFFFEQDIKNKLLNNIPKLSRITFHAKLGNMQEKVERLSKLALFIAMWVPFANLEKVEKAANLAKADLMTYIVQEFPELQGLMGKIYAELEGYDKEVYEAIQTHYLPLGPESQLPEIPEAITVSLADKIDNIVGFFSIDEIPTSSKDPYALRRAALGIIRIIIQHNIQIPLKIVLDTSFTLYPSHYFKNNEVKENVVKKHRRVVEEIIEFIFERFKYYKKLQGIRQDVFDAVMALTDSDNLATINNKIVLLEKLLADGSKQQILIALNRVESILYANEDDKHSLKVNEKLFENTFESDLFELINDIKNDALKYLKYQKYEKLFEVISVLVNPINQFFDNVIVNDERPEIRKNRLALLQNIQELTKGLANFSMLNFRN
ncbi:MAG: glycine--tRNA ligase subunit beta [Sphingobacteriia bacterium]|nr:glycine--tRNA ligase subunit beta [Sphingobacteriia bacterium]